MEITEGRRKAKVKACYIIYEEIIEVTSKADTEKLLAVVIMLSFIKLSLKIVLR